MYIATYYLSFKLATIHQNVYKVYKCFPQRYDCMEELKQIATLNWQFSSYTKVTIGYDNLITAYK